MAKIGLLGLYLQLYDERTPGMRKITDDFYETIAAEFEKKGIDVIRRPLCRLENEFTETIKYFEENNADGLVTLHLAYSPSLESSDALKETSLPIYILNTTPDYSFIVNDEYNAILYNHGIHGVQDMCNLLLRNGKTFEIESGHWKESDAIEKLCNKITQQEKPVLMNGIRVGTIGSPFKGMGDFAVDYDVLESCLGIKTIECNYEELKKEISLISDREISDEINENRDKYEVVIRNKNIYEPNIRTCLGVRKWIQKNNLDAFTVNFLDVDSKNGLSSVPFYEASKQMASGIGYAGEGDAMTAGLVSVLSKICKEASFTEIFCPDWSENALFLSHMGEMNINMCSSKPVLHEKNYIFSEVEVNPIVFSGEFKPGEAILVNLAPSCNGGFTLITVPVEMFTCNKVNEGVRGWFRPKMPVPEFLSDYSRHGGTHHSALVYGNHIDKIKNFAKAMNFKYTQLPDG